MATPALVHDYLLTLRGAERAFAGLASCWPSAPIYTLLHDQQGVDGAFADRDVRTSFLQRMNVRQRSFRRLLPLYPWAVKRLGVERYPLVISSTSAWAHRVRTRADAIHIAWCHIPFRYAWYPDDAVAATPRPLRSVVAPLLRRMREGDWLAAQRVTHYVANSRLTQERVARFYGREADIVHPPVDVDRFAVAAPEDYFLVVGEIAAHKRVGVALEAARRAGARVIVVGDGPERHRLAAAYAGTAEFAGRVDDDELSALYSRARALVMANVEDFGIAAVEAQAAGRPVLSVTAGGATETVLDGRTGVLVPPGDINAMAEAMRFTDFDRFDAHDAIRNAARFSVARFRVRFTRKVLELTASAPSAAAAAAAALAPDL